MWKIAKSLAGILLLGIAIGWAVREGDLWARTSGALLVAASVAGIASIACGGLILHFIAKRFGKTLPWKNALGVSAVGALGNAMGGIPIGTTIKYAILHREVGLSIAQISIGLIVFTLGISGCFLLIAASTVWLVEAPRHYRNILLLLGVIGAATALAVPLAAPSLKRWRHLLSPLLNPAPYRKVVLLSGLTAATYLLQFIVIAWFLLPQQSVVAVVFIAAVGLLLSQGSLIQSIGGVQEFLVGLSAWLSGLNPVEGVQVSLLVRASSTIAAILFVPALYRRKQRARPAPADQAE